LAFATFFVWRLRTGACGVGACGYWRYRMPPEKTKYEFEYFREAALCWGKNKKKKLDQVENKNLTSGSFTVNLIL